MSIERRVISQGEFRAESNGDKRTIGGYAAVFDQLSPEYYGFREQIAGGAFKSSLKNDIRALWSHNPDFVLGRTTSGTLQLEEDSTGLKFSLDLPDTSTGRDVFELISRGDVTGMSFGFRVKKESWKFSEKKGEPDVRTLEEVDLIEVSPVAFPWYPTTEVGVREMRDAHEKARMDHYRSIGKPEELAKKMLNLKFLELDLAASAPSRENRR